MIFDWKFSPDDDFPAYTVEYDDNQQESNGLGIN
jgi:hypothetical protein